MLLEVDHLGAAYDGVPALHDVSFAVEEGQIVVLIGSNGAGKSTTLRTISGLIRPAHGTVTYQGQRLDGQPAHRIAELGIAHVPEARKLFGRLTVRQNLLVGSYAKRGREHERETMEQIFTMFPRLEERADQRAATLSGGEQQMLAVARGLVQKPKVLLIDEMSMGLAPVIVESLLPVVRRIADDTDAA